MRSMIPLMCLLAACKGGGDSRDQPAGDPPPGPTRTAAPDQAKGGLGTLEVDVDGKRVAVSHALLKRKAPDRYQLYLSDQGGSCAELLSNLFNSSDRIDVLADLTPRLAADGSQVLEVSELYEGGKTIVITPGSKATVGGTADAGSKVEISIDLDATGDGTTIAAHGTFTAEGCGADEAGSDGVPRAAHPSTATITIAGKKLPIQSAIIKGKEVAPVNGAAKVRDILLSTGPKDCSGTTPWAAVIVERHWGSWGVSGTWFARALANEGGLPDEATGALVVTVGAGGTSDDGPTVALDLGGTGTIGGYPVELAGTIEALDCGE